MILGTGQYNLDGEFRRRTNNRRVIDLFDNRTDDPLIDYIETVLDKRETETVETITDNWS